MADEPLLNGRQPTRAANGRSSRLPPALAILSPRRRISGVALSRPSPRPTFGKSPKDDRTSQGRRHPRGQVGVRPCSAPPRRSTCWRNWRNAGNCQRTTNRKERNERTDKTESGHAKLLAPRADAPTCIQIVLRHQNFVLGPIGGSLNLEPLDPGETGSPRTACVRPGLQLPEARVGRGGSEGTAGGVRGNARSRPVRAVRVGGGGGGIPLSANEPPILSQRVAAGGRRGGRGRPTCPAPRGRAAWRMTTCRLNCKPKWKLGLPPTWPPRPGDRGGGGTPERSSIEPGARRAGRCGGCVTLAPAITARPSPARRRPQAGRPFPLLGSGPAAAKPDLGKRQMQTMRQQCITWESLVACPEIAELVTDCESVARHARWDWYPPLAAPERQDFSAMRSMRRPSS